MDAATDSWTLLTPQIAVNLALFCLLATLVMAGQSGAIPQLHANIMLGLATGLTLSCNYLIWEVRSIRRAEAGSKESSSGESDSKEVVGSKKRD